MTYRSILFAVTFCFLAVEASAQFETADLKPKRQAVPPSSASQGILVVFPKDDVDRDVWAKMSAKSGLVFETKSSLGATVDADTLAESFRTLMEKLGTAFVASPTPLPNGYDLDQIEVELQITAEGSVGILASGKIGATGGIRVVLKRAPAKP